MITVDLCRVSLDLPDVDIVAMNTQATAVSTSSFPCIINMNSNRNKLLILVELFCSVIHFVDVGHTRSCLNDHQDPPQCHKRYGRHYIFAAS